jgi:hypothetical protein
MVSEESGLNILQVRVISLVTVKLMPAVYDGRLCVLRYSAGSGEWNELCILIKGTVLFNS